MIVISIVIIILLLMLTRRCRCYIVHVPKIVHIITIKRNVNKCVSRLARRIAHHTALSNAAAPNS